MDQAGIGPEVGTSYGRYVATKVEIAVDRLLALDDLWTDELERASGRGRLDESEVEVLGGLVEEMRAGLAELEAPLSEFLYMVERAPEGAVDSAFAQLVESRDFPPDLADEIRANPGDYELQGAAVEACNYLLAEAGEESSELAQKLSRIEEDGEVPPGDLRPAFRCALVLAGVVAGVAISIHDGGTTVMVGLKVTAKLGFGVRRWLRNACPRRLPNIRFGRDRP